LRVPGFGSPGSDVEEASMRRMFLAVSGMALGMAL